MTRVDSSFWVLALSINNYPRDKSPGDIKPIWLLLSSCWVHPLCGWGLYSITGPSECLWGSGLLVKYLVEMLKCWCPHFSRDWYLPSARIVWTALSKNYQLISFTVLMGIQLKETEVFAGCKRSRVNRPSSADLLVALIEVLIRDWSHETQHFHGSI